MFLFWEGGKAGSVWRGSLKLCVYGGGGCVWGYLSNILCLVFIISPRFLATDFETEFLFHTIGKIHKYLMHSVHTVIIIPAIMT